ncbi:MAG: YidC/Oxa1 family insertase periplasmic-domain containing protein [Bythopirellula sp.]|nr:YidC/Oxa1 family insertase periplasmic-domain containing protein [Bythopirellula sp.]
MDQRRVILFLILSFTVLVLNSFFLAPPRPPKKLPPKAEQQQAAAEPAGKGAGAEAVPVVDADKEAAEEVSDFPEQEETELTYLTVGSVDPDSPFRSLFTFTNQGAGVRRVELANPRFRDLDDRTGYIGHLELVPDPAGGLRVQVVGAGTPAAIAGVEVGDRIVSVKEKNTVVKLESAQQFAELLARNKPRAKFSFSIVRGKKAPRQLEATLGRRPLEVMRPESENVLMRTKTLPAGFVDVPSFLFTLQSIGEEKIRAATELLPEASEIDGVELRETNWEVAQSDNESITFRKLLPKFRLELIKRYKLEPIPPAEQKNRDYPAYGLTLEVEVKNLGSEAVDLAYRLDGANGLPIEGWWFARKFGRNWGTAGLRDVVGRYFGSDAVEQAPTTIANGDGTDFEGGSMAFIGVDAQYFAAMLLPLKKSPEEVWLEVARPISLSPKPRSRSSDGLFANVSCRLISKTNVLQPGETLAHAYTVFTGPKRPDLLANYVAANDPKYTLADLMYYGWFGAVARGMLWLLHTFYGWVGNYGIAIIMLTVLVRSCMFPISRKQAQSMAKMQELKPELEKIKEKYGKDPAKQSQAMQELYRKYNINPLAGCLPMFIQLPIFVGLYRALAVDVELRQAPLISESIRWCSNLAAPDMLWNWSAIMPSFITSGEGMLGLGPYLNILPLITVGLFIVQQNMFMPEPTNEQAALQQKIMKYMMIFMGILFYKVAAGLCIYFIASSMWGIAERKLMPSMTAAALTPVPTPETKYPRGTAKNGAAFRDTKPKKKR